MRKKLKYIKLFEGQWVLDKTAIPEMKLKVLALKNENDNEELYYKATEIQDDYYNIIGNDDVYRQLFKAVEEQRKYPNHSVWKYELDKLVSLLTQLEN